jgi:hypothetical protein
MFRPSTTHGTSLHNGRHFFCSHVFVSSFQNKVCQVSLRTQRGRPSCPRRRRGQDGHCEPDPVTPVTPQTISSDLEGGRGRGRGRGWRKTGRTFSSFNIPNVLAFFSRSAPCWVPFPVARVQAERRRRDVPPTPPPHVPRRPRGPRRRRHCPHRPRWSIGPFPRCSPHRRTYIKIRFLHGSAGGPVEILNFWHVTNIAHVGRSVPPRPHVAHVVHVGRSETTPTSPTSVNRSPPRLPHRGTYIKIVFRTGRPEALWKF